MFHSGFQPRSGRLSAPLLDLGGVGLEPVGQPACEAGEAVHVRGCEGIPDGLQGLLGAGLADDVMRSWLSESISS